MNRVQTHLGWYHHCSLSTGLCFASHDTPSCGHQIIINFPPLVQSTQRSEMHTVRAGTYAHHKYYMH